jgi:hypothetical protein
MESRPIIMLDEKIDLIDNPQAGLQFVAMRGRERGRAQEKNDKRN